MNAIKAMSGTFANQAGRMTEGKIYYESVNFFIFFVDLTSLVITISFVPHPEFHTQTKTVSISRHSPLSYKAGAVVNSTCSGHVKPVS